MAQHDWETGKTLTSDQTDFEPLMAIGGDNRSQSIGNEIAMRDRLVGLLQNLSELKWDRLEIGLKQGSVVSR